MTLYPDNQSVFPIYKRIGLIIPATFQRGGVFREDRLTNWVNKRIFNNNPPNACMYKTTKPTSCIPGPPGLHRAFRCAPASIFGLRICNNYNL